MSLLVLCLFLLYRLLNMFRATLCPSSGADDLEVLSDVLQSCNNNTTHCYSSATHLINTSKSSAPEDEHKVARNMLSNL